MDLKRRKIDFKKDLEILFKIDNLAFCKPYDCPAETPEQLLNYLKGCESFAYYSGEKAIGSFSFRIKNKDQAELKQMMVSPEFQHKGIGKKMVKDFLKLVKNKKIYTVTHPKNTPALILYLKNGFEIYGWKDNYYGDGEPRLLLKRV